MNSFLPSSNVMSRPLARLEPSFARYPSMSTTVPGNKDFRLKPRRNKTFGVPASNAQFSTFPSGCFTSMCSQTWGLTHSIFVTVPFIVTGLFASNPAAKAWCA